MNPDNTEIFVASPGTGKTTRLMDLLGGLLEDGVSPRRIVYTTMSRAGSGEGRERALTRFTGLSEGQMPFFKTLHSIGFNVGTNKTMIKRSDYIELGKRTGFPMKGSEIASGEGYFNGDQLINMDKLRRLRCQTYEEAFMDCGKAWLTVGDFEYIGDSYENYKKSMGLIDYTDMIGEFVRSEQTLPVDYLFVDEAQDSSRLQWKMLELIGSTCKKIWVAGDDKQCIYEFTGADPDTLIQLEGKRTVLDQSYRIPKPVHDYAETIAGKIKHKAEYTFKPRKGTGGVKRIRDLAELNLKEGKWLLLARNKKFLESYENMCMQQGVLFTTIGSGGDNSDLPNYDDVTAVIAWNKLTKGGIITAKEAKILYGSYLPSRDRVKRGFKKVMLELSDDEVFTMDTLTSNYGLTCTEKWDIALKLDDTLKQYLKRVEEQEGLAANPRIEINTMHGVKGKEADNVVMLPDMAYPSHKEMETNPDSEHRVFYVGATRAKEFLYLMPPSSKFYYDL